MGLIAHIQGKLGGNDQARAELCQEAAAAKLLSGVLMVGGAAMVAAAITASQAAFPILFLIGIAVMITTRDTFVMADRVEKMADPLSQASSDVVSAGVANIRSSLGSCRAEMFRDTWVVGSVYNLLFRGE